MQPSSWIFVQCLFLTANYAAATQNRFSAPVLSVGVRRGLPFRILVKPPPTEDRYYRTQLSLDGGGLRLHMTNQILKLLESHIREYYLHHQELLPEEAKGVTSPDQIEVQLAHHFDLISGVSGGSWVALYYASKGGNGAAAKVFNSKYIIDRYGHLYPGCATGLDVFFEVFGKVIYPPRGICSIPKPKLSLRGFCVDIPGVTVPFYPVRGLEETLKLFYGDTKLSQMDTATAVYAFDVDLRNPVLFVYNTSQPEPHSDAILIQSQDTFFIPDRARSFQTHIRRSRDERYLEARRQDFYIRDLGRASSALPAVHAAKRFTAVNNKTAQYDCIDGGLVAPNPTLNSLMFMLSMDTISEIDRIATLSLGTGAVVGDYALNADSPWRWLTSLDLFRVVVDGGSQVLQANLHYMFYDQLHVRDKQFLRIQPLTNDTSNYAEALNSITDVSQLDMLKTIGELVARDYTDDLNEFIVKFIFGTEEKDQEMKKA